MKLSNKNLIIILVLLLVVFGLLQLTKREGKSRDLRSELVNIDSTGVTSIEIASPDNFVKLDKSDSGWMVQLENGKQKPVRRYGVINLISTLNRIEPSRLASRDNAKWNEYGVDSTGTRVKVMKGSEVVSDLIIGNFGLEGQNSFFTYVRLPEDENVYVANNFMKMSVNVDPNDYRNSTVARIETDSLVSISFNYPDSSFNLINNGKWVLDAQQADSAAVVNYLKDLRVVTNTNFIESAIGSPTHTIKYSYSNRPEIVISAVFDGDMFNIQSSENNSEHFQDQELFEKLFVSKSVFDLSDQ